MSRHYLLLSFISIVLLFSSCGSKKKNTPIKRAYHNVTAHYNGYFNAKVRIDAAEKQAEQAFQDKYDDLLPVFKITAQAAGASAKGGKSSNQPLDEAIKKASLVIQRHEISKWIDDCYFEIGRAYFYKNDYFTASETFQFVAGKYKNKETGNKSYIWLIKSYLVLKKYQQAESVINVALASENFPKKHLSDLFAAVGAFYIDKKNYPKAIEYLEKSLVTEKKKAKKARYSFIIAQLYDRLNDGGKAALYYQKVIKMNPSYEMLFNAQINSARLVQGQSFASRKIMEKQLEKMLKDDKNKEYRDQIYYSLGLIKEQNNDREAAIRNFQLSAANSIMNTSQKASSFLKLATIYYDEESYENAQYYYDSTSTFIAKTHPEYELVNQRKTSLSKLVQNLNIIKREDSLLKVSRLPETERIALVNKIIAQEKEEKIRKDEEQKRLAELAMNNMAISNQSNTGNTGNKAASGSWYFYNLSAVGIGNSEFLTRFGKRTLEDNWRRANKESYTALFTEEEEEDPGNNNTENKEASKNEDDALRKKYLANIPVSPQAQEISNEKILKAYFTIGQFYREEIINYKQSVKAYEAAVSRYPGNKYLAEIYYNLYKAYTSLNNKTQSESYKNKILTLFPNSLYAKVIQDPDFISDAKAEDKRAQSYYDNLYISFSSGDYGRVIASKSYMDSTFGFTSIGPKYSYLYALSIAKTNGVDALEKSLNDLVNKYPSSDAASKARETLQKIAETKNPALAKTRDEDPIPFSVESRTRYSVIISTSLKANLRETKNHLIQLNIAQFSLQKINVSSELVGQADQIIIIKDFEDVAKANEYIAILNKQAGELINFQKEPYQIFFISEKNLKLMQEKKSINRYIDFYKSNYLTNE